MLFYCEKYLKLTSFSSLILSENKELIVKSKKVKYFIYGNSIIIKYFSRDEIIVQGIISSIKFEYEK